MSKLFIWLTLLTICFVSTTVSGNAIIPYPPRPCQDVKAVECCRYSKPSDEFYTCCKKYDCVPFCGVPDCKGVYCPAIYCPRPVYRPGECCPICKDYEIYEKKRSQEERR
ncbi:hypothetical protein SK128_013541 [Halocaridina rubra]|uniref:Uncharacterized protein n=1 Tax=Halocaridina rubra TaxID=373956 RepID=A0AAN8ZYM5_HALRR